AATNHAVEAAEKAQERITVPENKQILEGVIKDSQNFKKLDTDYEQLQANLEKILQERSDVAEKTETLVKQLIQEVMEIYKNLEKEGTPLTTKHIENYGISNYLLEITATIKVRNRDLIIAFRDPKHVEEQNNVIKEIHEYFDEFEKTITSLQSSFVTQEAKDQVDLIKKQMTEWKNSNEQSVQVIREQAQNQQEQDTLSEGMINDSKTLISKISDRVKDVADTMESVVKVSRTFIIGVAVFAIFIGIVISLILSRNITVGLTSVMKTLKKVVLEGDLDVEIKPELTHRLDEVGEMALVGESILKDYKTVDTMANSLAGGDWRITVKEKSPLDTMNLNLSKMLDQVNLTLSEINDAVKQVATGAGEVSSAAQTLSSGAQESAASLEEITASMSEISSQTKANAQSSTEARDLAQKASHAASEGQQAMLKMTSAMDRITKNSTEIQRVIKVIDDIAFQTNLLALNAAVEAARAGVHGKGFAVVAEEVRNLAARSAKAAKETTDLIQTSGQEINRGGEVANHTSEVLNTIVEQIKQTTDLVAGIAIASNEQAQGVAQVTVGLEQIDAVTQQNTAAAEESASAANEMSSMASNLQQLVAKFQLRKSA
ncbi:MAG: methyl-accepting chemotaxis protein, partial [Planctomycetaceae bacterium]|nr:methyl-accepting chemotaxis protein [Planctomycetaceae bacterium]